MEQAVIEHGKDRRATHGRRTEPKMLRTRRSRAGHGFSLLELSVSLAVFLVAATVISLAVAQSLVTGAQAKSRRAVSAQVESLVVTMSGTPFSTLAADTFTPPQRCADDATANLIGSEAESCVTIEGYQYRVRWSVSHGDDGENTASSLSWLDVTATAELAGGGDVSSTRRVPAPSGAWQEGKAVVRVAFTGPYEDLDGPVQLLSGPLSDPQVAASAAVSSGGVALLRVDPSSCTQTSPCHVALSSQGVLGASGSVGMPAAALTGAQSEIVLNENALVGLTIPLFTTSSTSIAVTAESDDGRSAGNDAVGSVCLWGTFVSGNGKVSVPLCNSDDPAKIEVSTYAPSADAPEALVPLPVSTPITITVDHPSGSCRPASGMRGSTATGWVPAAVCTSWTWGIPAEWVTDGTTQNFTSPVITLSSTPHAFGAVFSGSAARPAAGYGSNAELWSRPRQAAGCAFDGTCQSFGSLVPEATECPGEHCLSAVNTAPRVTAPLQGPRKVSTVLVQGSTSFNITLADDDGDAFQATVTQIPEGGTLTRSGNAVEVGQSSNSASLSYVFTPANGWDGLDSLKLSVTDGKVNGTRIVEIGLVDSLSRPWLLQGSRVTVAQGSTTTLPVAVVSAGGSPLAGTNVSFTSTTGGLSVSPTALTDASGTATPTLSATTAMSGSRSVTASAGGRSVSLSVRVTQTVGDIDVSIGNIIQGGRATATITATDKAGVALEGAQVSLVVLSGATPSQSVYPEYAGCVLHAGACQVSVISDSDAATGSYVLRASLGLVTGTDSFLVSSSTASVVVAGSNSIPQGTSRTIGFRALDGSGSPVAGVTLTLSVPVAYSGKITVGDTTITTDATGRADVSVSVAASQSAGTVSLTVLASGRQWSAKLLVTSVLDSLDAASSTINLSQGGTATTWVLARDKAGNLMAGAQVVLSVSSATGVRVNAQATSGADGRAVVSLSALSTAPKGTSSVVATSGAFDASFAVKVTQTLTAVRVFGSPATGGPGEFRVFVTDGASQPILGTAISITAASGTPALVAQSGFTDSEGAVRVSVNTYGVATGVYVFSVTVNGKTINSSFRVSA